MAPQTTGEGGAASRQHMLAPIGAVGPVAHDDQDWLSEAPVALEKLRRHLEETGRTVLDGYAVLRLCTSSPVVTGGNNAVTAADVVNSELVLMREAVANDAHSRYEIARGDELTCWHQLELSLRDDSTGQDPASIEVRIPQEGDGVWLVNGERFVWTLETLKPNDFVPGLVIRQLSSADCEKLLRRYKLARRIHDGGFRHHDMTKRVDYLSSPPETWRVNLHRLQRILGDAGLNWESYIESFQADPQPMTETLPVGFVMQMIEDLDIKEPNQLFAWPALSDMAAVTDDKLLCSLLPRVDAVRYVKPRDLDPQTAANVHMAVDTFASSLGVQKMIAAGALPMQNDLPYLVYASEAQELRLTAESLGMRLYVAVAPHLISTAGMLIDVPGVKQWQWAFGHALQVRFEREETAK